MTTDQEMRDRLIALFQEYVANPDERAEFTLTDADCALLLRALRALEDGERYRWLSVTKGDAFANDVSIWMGRSTNGAMKPYTSKQDLDAAIDTARKEPSHE